MAINNYVLHIDTMLTQVSVMYRNGNCVAGQIFPSLPVDKRSDLYAVWGKDNLRSLDDLVVPKSQSNEIRITRSPSQYYCDGHALRYPLGDEETAEDDLTSLQIDVTTILMDQATLNREINLVNAISAGITTTVDLSASSGADQWSNDSFDPIKYIDAQKIAVALVTGKKPNTLVVSTPVLSALRNNATVKDRITGAPNLDGSAITLQQLANVMDVKQVLEASAVVNSAKQGQNDSLQFVWGKTALLCYVADSPGPRTVSLGYHFMWNYLAKTTGMAGQAKPIEDIIKNGAGYGIRMWYDQKIRCTHIESLMYYAQTIICPDAGIYFINAVA